MNAISNYGFQNTSTGLSREYINDVNYDASSPNLWMRCLHSSSLQPTHQTQPLCSSLSLSRLCHQSKRLLVLWSNKQAALCYYGCHLPRVRDVLSSIQFFSLGEEAVATREGDDSTMEVFGLRISSSEEINSMVDLTIVGNFSVRPMKT